MPPMNTGGFSEILAPGLMAIVGTRLKSTESWYKQFYNDRDTKRNYEDVLAAAGLPMASAKGEGDPIISEDALEGNTKRITPEEWGIGCEITQTAWEDDLYAGEGSPLRDAANGLADSLMERKEVEAHNSIFVDGFDSTAVTTLPNNTESIFATSHVPISGGEAAAQSNRVDVDLSVSSYRDAMLQFRKYVNDRGIRIPGHAKPQKLIAGVDLTYVMQEIVGSTWRPDTSNRVENVSRGEVSLVNTPYITLDDDWFIFAQKHYNDHFKRSGARFDNFDERRRRVAVFVAWERYKFQCYHWLGVRGSQGA